MSNCQGCCENHTGEVVEVSVIDRKPNYASKDWGSFWYCAKAIEEDKRRGLEVTVVEDALNKKTEE